MPPKRRRGRRVRRRARNNAPGRIVVRSQALVDEGATAEIHSNLYSVLTGRSYHPTHLSVQCSCIGAPGVLQIQLYSHDGSVVAVRSPLLIPVGRVRTVTLKWPRNTEWFPSTSSSSDKQLAHIDNVSNTATPTDSKMHIISSMSVLLSDYTFALKSLRVVPTVVEASESNLSRCTSVSEFKML